jgi:hypothetical protein
LNSVTELVDLYKPEPVEGGLIDKYTGFDRLSLTLCGYKQTEIPTFKLAFG